MTDADRATLARELIADEGTGPMVDGRHMPYKDSRGILTLGFGRNIQERGISREEAHFLLLQDIHDTLAEMYRAFPWTRFMSGARQRVLANMIFNMGLPTVRQFTNTLAAMQRGDFAGAAAGMRASLWARQVGARAERLAVLMERDGDVRSA